MTEAEASETMRCEKLKATMGGRSCAARWRGANEREWFMNNPHDPRPCDTACKGCPLGAERAAAIPNTDRMKRPIRYGRWGKPPTC